MMKAFLLKMAIKALRNAILPAIVEKVNEKLDEFAKESVDDNNSPITHDNVDAVVNKARAKVKESLDEVFARFE